MESVLRLVSVMNLALVTITLLSQVRWDLVIYSEALAFFLYSSIVKLEFNTV